MKELLQHISNKYPSSYCSITHEINNITRLEVWRAYLNLDGVFGPNNHSPKFETYNELQQFVYTKLGPPKEDIRIPTLVYKPNWSVLLNWVMIITIIILLLLTQSCTKDEPIGITAKYDGKAYIDIPISFTHTRDNTIIINETQDEGVITIQNLGSIGYAQMLSASTYRYLQLIVAGTSCGSTNVAKYSGTGTFVGDSLIENLTIVYEVNGFTYEGTCITRSKRRV